MQQTDEKYKEAIEAIDNDNLDRVVTLIGQTEINPSPEFPLHFYAAKTGKVEILKILLKRGGKTTVSGQGNLLFWACESEQTLEYLYEHFDEIDFQDGTTKDHIKAALGDIAYFKEHSKGTAALLAPDNFGYTPLYYTMVATTKSSDPIATNELLSHFADHNVLKINQAIWIKPQQSILSQEIFDSHFINAIKFYCKFDRIVSYPISKETFARAIIADNHDKNINGTSEEFDTTLIEACLDCSPVTLDLILSYYEITMSILRELKAELKDEKYTITLDNLHRSFAACCFICEGNTSSESLKSLQQAIVYCNEIKTKTLCDPANLTKYSRELGELHYKDDQWQDAIIAYQGALKANSERLATQNTANTRNNILSLLINAFVKLGNSHRPKREYSASIHAYQQALNAIEQMNPPTLKENTKNSLLEDITTVLMDHAIDHFSARKYQEALETYRQTMDVNKLRNPSEKKEKTNRDVYRCMAATYENLGLACIENFSFNEAKENFQQAIQLIVSLTPRVPLDYHRLSCLYSNISEPIAEFASLVFSLRAFHINMVLIKFCKEWSKLTEEKNVTKQTLFVLELILREHTTANFPNNAFKIYLSNAERLKGFEGLVCSARELLWNQVTLQNQILSDPNTCFALIKQVGALRQQVQHLQSVIDKTQIPVTSSSSQILANDSPILSQPATQLPVVTQSEEIQVTLNVSHLM